MGLFLLQTLHIRPLSFWSSSLRSKNCGKIPSASRRRRKTPLYGSQLFRHHTHVHSEGFRVRSPKSLKSNLPYFHLPLPQYKKLKNPAADEKERVKSFSVLLDCSELDSHSAVDMAGMLWNCRIGNPSLYHAAVGRFRTRCLPEAPETSRK